MQRATVTYYLPCSALNVDYKYRTGPTSMHGANQVVQISDVLIIQDCKDDHCK